MVRSFTSMESMSMTSVMWRLPLLKHPTVATVASMRSFPKRQSLAAVIKAQNCWVFFFFMQNTLQQLVAAHSLVQRDDFLPYIVPHSSCQVLLVRWQVLTSSQRLRAWSCNHNKNQCYNQMTIRVLFVMKPVQHTWHLLVHHLHDGMISK